MKNPLIIFLFIISFLSPSVLFAGSPHECGEGEEIATNMMIEQAGEFRMFTLWTEKTPRYMLILDACSDGECANDDGVFRIQWQLARLSSLENREPQYCIVGRGYQVEFLVSLHEGKSEEKFGLPGSGNPRCSDDKIASSLAVRIWAHKELGESETLYLHNELGDNYTYLKSHDGYWVIINHSSPESACYYDRGDEVSGIAGDASGLKAHIFK